MKLFHLLTVCAVVVLVGALSSMSRLHLTTSGGPDRPSPPRHFHRPTSLSRPTDGDDPAASSALETAGYRTPRLRTPRAEASSPAAGTAQASPGASAALRCGGWCTDVCGDMKAASLVGNDDVAADVKAYLERHVLIALVTGSFEKFFRMDIALCSWLRHVPASNFVIVTDNATKATEHVEGSPAQHRTRATWIEGVLPSGVKFSRRQVESKGYTLGWIKAQFRFVQGLEALAAIAQLPGYDAHEFDLASVDRNRREVAARSAALDARWLLVLDDDTFTSLPALVKMLRSYDKSLCAKASAAGATERKALATESDDSDEGGSPNPADVAPSGPSDEPPTEAESPEARNAQDSTSSSGGGGDDACAVHPSRWRPTYLGEHGWGGAGHVFSFSAAARVLGKGYEPCVEQNMIRKFYASDVALKKCMPGAGIVTTSDSRLSHCQATFLRERMLSGRHVSSHVKRELDKHPRLLALWRMRLYYQAMYHGNKTAYSTLMDVGACAYGSCKIGKCRKEHDAASTALFERLSHNNTVLPLS